MQTLPNKAVFLDRDGVVILEKGYISSPEQLELYPFTREAITKLKEAHWKIYIITNQAGVARGVLTEEDLDLIHQRLLKLIPVDKIYYCPHHPDGKAGLPYSIHCDCRKPEAGMIYKAAQENRIDLRQSYLLGDRASDIIAGKTAGLVTALVLTGYGAGENAEAISPDYVFADLLEFAEFLIGTEKTDRNHNDG